MKPIIVLLAIFGCALTGPVQDRSITNSSVNTQVLIERYGYPFEEHKVVTEDGYILAIHRIPYSPKNVASRSNGKVIYLQHGLLCSSSDWVLPGPDSGLAFILSDLGYDVWMGNARGNTYSRSHETKSPLFQSFWRFDWHEIGLIDLPTMINYVLSKTGESQVDYVGHSQGTTTFLLLNTRKPEMAEKIRSAHMLAPVAYMSNMESPLAKVGGPILGNKNPLVDVLGSMEFLPNNAVMEIMGKLVCEQNKITSPLCSNSLFLLGGFNPDNLNETLVPEMMATTPAGCSVNQVLHYLQEYNSGEFREWDYGLLGNMRRYKQATPPIYDIDNIQQPCHLYYADNDYFVGVEDAHRLAGQLAATGALVKMHRVEDPKFTHIDFLWGLNVKEMVYNHLIKNLGH